MQMEKKKNIIIWTILSSLVIIIIGVIWHFLNDWLGFIPFLRAIAPVNESVWEHLKLTLWPVLLTWLFIIPLMNYSHAIDLGKTMLSVAVCMMIANFFILGIYYTLSAGFTIGNSFTDISSYVIGILAGQLFAAAYIIPSEIPKWLAILGWIVVLSAILIYSFFTYSTPDYPIFTPPNEI